MTNLKSLIENAMWDSANSMPAMRGAQAVLAALDKAGLVIVPLEPPPQDPDEALAAEICAQYFEGQHKQGRADVFREGLNRGNDTYCIALMCIRAGREAAEKDMGK